MKKQILDYEKFIKQASSRGLSEAERVRLANYHHEMMESFQHERLIHLIVTLFFVLVTLASLTIMAGATFTGLTSLEVIIPLYVLVGLLMIITFCYVKHYYFLENHIQKMYKYTTKISGVKDAK